MSELQLEYYKFSCLRKKEKLYTPKMLLGGIFAAIHMFFVEDLDDRG